ncbi:MAG: hypothetical protein OEX02_06915, partial [Cyclobacteriaceae bacterium]|nr:hypothetical protein [Cyclobacteriaceae bacterium]
SKLSVVRRDKQGRLWGGDRYKGLISIRTDGIESIMPNGPFSNNIWRFDVSGNKLMVSAGGYDVSSSPSNSFEGIFQFEAGKWSNFNRYEYPTYEDISDIVDITTSGSSSGFFSAFGKGIYKFDHLSSPNLITLPGLGVNPRVSSLYYDEDGLWFTLIGSTDALWLYGNDSQLTSFNIGSNTHPSELLGHQDYIYIRLEPDVGGRMIVFDKITKRHRYLSATEGAGGLPGDRVNAMVLDQQGKLWLGTDQGVAFFDRMAMEGPVDAIKPMVGYVPLFRGKEVLALTVDGGNRKWIGTTQGVWLYDAQGESEIVHFNQNNSPLLPGNIRGIAVLPASGEVFFGTENGIVSYRSDATAGAQQHTNVKIFPNPVIPEYNGLVGISGLPMAADVKVTDAAGRLVWKGVSNGGTASWNVLDYRGQRPASGVYFVFSVAPDGTDTYVGKIAVIK